MATSSYSLDNEVFASLLIYSALLIFKTVLLIPLTSYYRIIKGSLPSLEDAKFFAPNNPDKQKQLLRPDESVQRVRKAHLNDLENVIPFVMMSLLYIGTNPDLSTALWHFRIFLAARVLHSLVYLMKIRQPFRALAFLIGSVVFMSMIVRTIVATCQYL